MSKNAKPFRARCATCAARKLESKERKTASGFGRRSKSHQLSRILEQPSLGGGFGITAHKP